MTQQTEAQLINEILAQIAIKAEGHRRVMEQEQMSEAEVLQYVNEIVEGADLVFGVWPDPNHPDGFGGAMIKGTRFLADGDGTVPRIDAVPSMFLAIAAKAHFDPVH